jgi:RHS repeat-associated protein
LINQLNTNTLTPEFQAFFAYNGMMKDDEIQGIGNSYTTEFRQYDARLGRWTALDPMATEREWVSPYNFAQNNPINRVDPSGALDDWIRRTDEKGKMKEVWEYDSSVQSPEEAKAKYGENTEYLDDGGTYQGFKGGKKIGTVTVHTGGLQTWKGGSQQNTDLYQPELFVQPSNHTPDEPYGYLKGVSLDFDFGGGPRDINNFNLSQRSRNFNNSLNRLALTNFLVTGSPLIGFGLETTSPLWGTSLTGTIGEGYLGMSLTRTVIDGSAQVAVNGYQNLDLLAAFASGFFLPGASATYGGGIDYKPFSNGPVIRVVGYNKSPLEAVVDGSMKYTFGRSGYVGRFTSRLGSQMTSFGAPQLSPIINAPFVLGGKLATKKLKYEFGF